jgi:hypothetical protein
MLTGKTLRTRTLQSAAGLPVEITILQPDAPNQANRDALFATSFRWTEDAKRLIASGDYDASRRAHFASDVAYIAASGILSFPFPDTNYLLVAQDSAGNVRGLMMFRLDDQTWELDLLTTDPQDQGGNPNTDPVRGIGSELLGAGTDLMNARLCTQVRLEPLDERAEQYWRGRGFTPVAGSDYFQISCPELQALAARYAHSPHDDTDMVVCSPATRARWQEVSLHGQ